MVVVVVASLSSSPSQGSFDGTFNPEGESLRESMPSCGATSSLTSTTWSSVPPRQEHPSNLHHMSCYQQDISVTVNIVKVDMSRAIADKRIPVTEKTWKELGDLKQAGETYDRLIRELIEDCKKKRLFKRLDEIEENSRFVRLGDV